jgi:hypothetical protein
MKPRSLENPISAVPSREFKNNLFLQDYAEYLFCDPSASRPLPIGHHQEMFFLKKYGGCP